VKASEDKFLVGATTLNLVDLLLGWLCSLGSWCWLGKWETEARRYSDYALYIQLVAFLVCEQTCILFIPRNVYMPFLLFWYITIALLLFFNKLRFISVIFISCYEHIQ
jgi:hypothetical protein